MSNWINWRIAIVRNPSLSFGAKGMGLYLNTYMNDRHDFAFPSIATICGEMSVSNKTAIKYLAELERAGMLKREKRYGKSVIYHATISAEIRQEVIHSLNSSVNLPLVEQVHSSSGESTLTVVEDLHTNKQKNKQENKQTPRARDFDQFWERYPKHVGKIPAERAWNRLTAEQKDAALADCADRYRTTGKQFIPNPATYLNQHRWSDEKITHEAQKPNRNKAEVMHDTLKAIAAESDDCGDIRQDVGEIWDALSSSVSH